MNRLRSHIIRLTTIFLIGLGFSLYLVQPSQAKQNSQSFASWFCKMTKSSDSAGLQKELASLHYSGDQLGNVIKEASQIVIRNNSDFEFSFSESITSDHLYQLLLIEWSQFQTENAMSSVPVQHITKLILPATLDKLGADGWDTPVNLASHFSKGAFDFTIKSVAVFCFTLTPMVDSIAIGAP